MKMLDAIRFKVNTKLTIILLLATLLPVLIFGALIISSSVKGTHDSYEKSGSAMLLSVGRRLDDYIAKCEESLFFAIYDNNDSAEIDVYNNLQKQLLYIMFMRPEHESLLYYFPARQEVYIINSAGNRSFFNAGDIEQTEWYKRATERDGTCIILGQHRQTGYADRYSISPKKTVFTICRSFKPPTGGKSVLAINCELSGVEEITGSAESMAGETLTCLTTDGQLLYTGNSELSAEDTTEIYNQLRSSGNSFGSFIYQSLSDSKSYTIVYQTSEKYGLHLYKCIPNTVLNSYVVDSVKAMVVIMVIIMLCIIPISALLSRTVTKPLSTLERNLRTFGQGNIHVRAEIHSHDEIGSISDAFNDMAGQIQQLIQEQYTLKLSNQAAQYYSLIAQINPHFINNVLQSIGCVALDKDAPEIYEAATVLSKMLRYSIKGKDTVTLDNELENASNYLFVQKFRYEDNLSYFFEVDDELRGASIPKLTLQPLVENAVVHGLEGKKGPGVIQIICRSADNGKMQIVIKDDGLGISPDKLEELRQKFKLNDQHIEIDTQSVGLINVYQRLRIIYRNDFSLQIESCENVGTQLSLLVPFTKYEV